MNTAATSGNGSALGSAALLIAKDHYKEPSGFCGLYSNPPFTSFLGFKSRAWTLLLFFGFFVVFRCLFI